MLKSKYLGKAVIMILIALNLGTLLYVRPLSQNLSDFGNTLGHKTYLILWAASASSYFYIYTYRLMKLTSYPLRLGKVLLFIACLGMIISVLIPYAPYQNLYLSKWHTRIALFSTIAYITLFFHYLFDGLTKNYAVFNKMIKLYTNLVVFDSLLYLMNGGVSTLLEISYTIGMIVLLPYIVHTYKKDAKGCDRN